MKIANRIRDGLAVLGVATIVVVAFAFAPLLHAPAPLVPYLPAISLVAIAGNALALFYLKRSVSSARIDGLTGLANRHTFDETVSAQLALAKRCGHPLSIIRLDVDWFKKYNDFYGHPAGDEALRYVAQSIARALPRKTDLGARYGGEEFAVVLPATDYQGAKEVAARIGTIIRGLQIEHSGSDYGRITVSLGISAYVPDSPRKAPSTKDLLRLADAALYQAKEFGRDRTVLDIGLLFDTPLPREDVRPVRNVEKRIAS